MLLDFCDDNDGFYVDDFFNEDEDYIGDDEDDEDYIEEEIFFEDNLTES